MSVGNGQQLILRETGIFPTVQSLATLEHLPNYEQRWIDVSLISAEAARPNHFVPKYVEWWNAALRELAEVWVGRKRAEEAAQAMVPVINEILADGIMGDSSLRHDSIPETRAVDGVRENLEGWLFASPWILGFLIFTLGPMIASGVLAFADWDIVTPPRWTGQNNFDRFVPDTSALHAIRVTTIYAIVSVPLQIVLGLGMALLLNAEIWGLRMYRTIYYLPAVLSGVAVALLWRWIFSRILVFQSGVGVLGIDGPGWF